MCSVTISGWVDPASPKPVSLARILALFVPGGLSEAKVLIDRLGDEGHVGIVIERPRVQGLTRRLDEIGCIWTIREHAAHD
jgi:hypothetical protein